MPIWPARRVGFAASNFARISCQESAVCAKPLSIKAKARNSPEHDRIIARCMRASFLFIQWHSPDNSRTFVATNRCAAVHHRDRLLNITKGCALEIPGEKECGADKFDWLI